jgi:hypothetical protein
MTTSSRKSKLKIQALINDRSVLLNKTMRIEGENTQRRAQTAAVQADLITP